MSGQSPNQWSIQWINKTPDLSRNPNATQTMPCLSAMMPELKVPVEPKKLATFAAGRGHFALLQLVRGAIDLRGPKGIYLNNYA